jgi:apolipoprotein N-acyltransferase
VYGEFVTEYVRKGAGMLFIITNDGWWGNTPGHRQHFQYARLRAIETRRCIARSANTGISGFINQRGDVLQQTPYWQDAVISGKLLYDTTITFYVQYGDFLGRLSLFMSVFLLLYVFVKDFLKKKRL